MTREEQIMKKVNEVCNDPNNDWKSTWDLCQMIAEWADKTMLDKVCQWLDKEMEDYVERFNDDDVQPIVISGSYDYKKDFIEALRKAMEEQQ